MPFFILYFYYNFWLNIFHDNFFVEFKHPRKVTIQILLCSIFHSITGSIEKVHFDSRSNYVNTWMIEKNWIICHFFFVRFGILKLKRLRRCKWLRNTINHFCPIFKYEQFIVKNWLSLFLLLLFFVLKSSFYVFIWCLLKRFIASLSHFKLICTTHCSIFLSWMSLPLNIFNFFLDDPWWI
jgi:hypothetical protein